MLRNFTIGILLIAVTALVTLMATGKLKVSSDIAQTAYEATDSAPISLPSFSRPVGLTDADIEKVKSDITAEFTANRVNVEIVEIVIESPRKAIGFMKGTVRTPTGEMWSGTRLFQQVQVYYNCSVTMGSGDASADQPNIIWRCDP